MTPQALRDAMGELGLSPRDFAGVLAVPDADAIRLWSRGGVPIPGPVALRIRQLLADWRRAQAVARRVIKEAVEPQIAETGVTPQEVTLTVYDHRSIARLRAEEPGATLSLHNLVNRATAMLLAEMGIATRLTVIGEGAYVAWLAGRADSRALRREYAASAAARYRLALPLASTPLGDALLRLQDIPEAIKRLEVAPDADDAPK